jgi:hypothetical protein
METFWSGTNEKCRHYCHHSLVTCEQGLIGSCRERRRDGIYDTYHGWGQWVSQSTIQSARESLHVEIGDAPMTFYVNAGDGLCNSVGEQSDSMTRMVPYACGVFVVTFRSLTSTPRSPQVSEMQGMQRRVTPLTVVEDRIWDSGNRRIVTRCSGEISLLDGAIPVFVFTPTKSLRDAVDSYFHNTVGPTSRHSREDC